MINSSMPFSLLFPEVNSEDKSIIYNVLSETAFHDLGLDVICKGLSKKENEQNYIIKVMSRLTADPEMANYRAEIFDDILHNPNLRSSMLEILDKISFLRDYGSFKREHEESASTWELMHRLEEINDYIACVEALVSCLDEAAITSRGLRELKEYVEAIYRDNGFRELKEDIQKCKASTTDLKSVTLGINLNERFEAENIGLVSVNSKKFTKSHALGGFSDLIMSKKGNINADTSWDENYKYHQISEEDIATSSAIDRFGKFMTAASSPLAMLTLASIPEGDSGSDVTMYLDRIVNHILAITMKKLRDTLSKYVNITITNITNIIPELMYYIRWAEFVEKETSRGFIFVKPEVTNGLREMTARGIYNLKLAYAHKDEAELIVKNDLDFNDDNCVYILTGANRGGKTTITQAIGQLFVLAQGGIYIPGEHLSYTPVDNIYTHFPADEDKTMDLGRLGEECKRFKEIYESATDKSLLLLNETFSTTSFEEGYYIAKDSVKAILAKGTRTIYNTHMHKLAMDIPELNRFEMERTRGANCTQAQSLIVCAQDGERSYRVKVSQPEGMSYAVDIARKYGVMYDMLVNESKID